MYAISSWGQLLTDGILYGLVYALTAIGLSLIFGTMRIVFIAQGTIVVFLAYISYWSYRLLGIDPYLSLVIVLLVGFSLGYFFYRTMFKQASILSDRISSLLIAVGIMFFMENLMTNLWTPDPRAIVTKYAFFSLKLFGISLTLTRVISLVLGVLCVVGLTVFLKKTYLGIAIRAAAENPEICRLMGINPHKVNPLSFGIGLALAGVAALNIAVNYSFDPVYGIDIAVKALIALTLGGLNTIIGALIGGIMLGLIETISTYLVGAGWSQGILFGVFLLVLMFRPQGLFGR